LIRTFIPNEDVNIVAYHNGRRLHKSLRSTVIIRIEEACTGPKYRTKVIIKALLTPVISLIAGGPDSIDQRMISITLITLIGAIRLDGRGLVTQVTAKIRVLIMTKSYIDRTRRRMGEIMRRIYATIVSFPGFVAIGPDSEEGAISGTIYHCSRRHGGRHTIRYSPTPIMSEIHMPATSNSPRGYFHRYAGNREDISQYTYPPTRSITIHIRGVLAKRKEEITAKAESE